ncbi:TMEM43 family protein [Candidatus Halobeggiatoa sp. HSG11]|nr:TMEM43 family protein [Candidatus Halobeggiatoa sp. HSG11]
MKLCPDISNTWFWCTFIIFRTGVLLVFLFCGLPLIFYSVNWYFDIQINDKPLVETAAANLEDSMSIHHIDKSNEGKIIHLTGNTTTDYTVNDFLFGIELSDVIKLKRVVEKFDGQNWVNTTTSPINNTVFRAELVKLGGFTLSSKIIDETFFTFKKLPITKELFAQIPENLSNELGGELHLNDDNYFIGQNPAFPQVGDLRISFFVISTGTVSITARQVDSHLVSYHGIEIIFTFLKKINLVNTYYLSVFFQILPLYFFSFFSLSLGIYLIFLMLKTLIKPFPSSYDPNLEYENPDNPIIFRIFLMIIDASFFFMLIFIPMLVSVLIAIFLKEGIFKEEAFLLIALVITVPIIMYVIALLLSKLLKFIPFSDKFINQLNWLSAIIIAVSISLISIAITWAIYLPILSISLFIIAILNLYYSIPAAHRLLIVPNYEPPEPPLVQEMVVPQKTR